MFDYVSFKRSGYYGFSACLFVACALFVTHRGYKCLKKYAEEPESAEVSYKFTGDVTFPVITLCTSSFLESVKYVLNLFFYAIVSTYLLIFCISEKKILIPTHSMQMS